jgi:hypothetical protein
MLGYVSSSKTIYVCQNSNWAAVEVKGEKGEPGQPASPPVSTEQTATQLYEKHRRAVFRVSVACKVVNPACEDISPYTGGAGSAFLCAAGKICTNKHVLQCKPSGNQVCEYTIASMSLHAIAADKDSAAGVDRKLGEPFFKVDAPTITYHPTRDLATVSINNVPAGISPLELASETYDKMVKTLDPILSLSFPLGFSDLYTDLGSVNTADIRQCDANKKYGCAGTAYDFSTTNDTDHGSSGSPLIHVKSGKVVGVTTGGTINENANYTWAVDASLLKPLLGQ